MDELDKLCRDLAEVQRHAYAARSALAMRAMEDTPRNLVKIMEAMDKAGNRLADLCEKQLARKEWRKPEARAK